MNKSSPRHDKKATKRERPLSCAQCGLDDPPQAKFCTECGTLLLGRLKSEPQWRPLTVLFCDLVGSSPHGGRADLEKWRALFLTYQAYCHRVIHQFGGVIAQFLGDGVLAYFGYPQAYEHDARRAVEAGLCLIEEVGVLAQHGKVLKLRIGIHTGTVIIGPGQTRRLPHRTGHG